MALRAIVVVLGVALGGRLPSGLVPGDVVVSFRVPKNGTTTTGSVEPEIDLWCDDHRAFVTAHASAVMCCGLDGNDLGCQTLDATRIRLGKLNLGWHTLECALLEDGRVLTRPANVTKTSFFVVDDPKKTPDGQRLLELHNLETERSQKLLEWWHFGGTYDLEAPEKTTPRLIVGIKCAADAIVARDAMRRTWARHDEILVRFLIGRKDELNEQLEREQEKFHDLLIPANGYDIDDGYLSLVGKTKRFCKWVIEQNFFDGFVMLGDDDIYVDVPALLKALPLLPKTKFYGGQVWADHFNQAKLPQRDPGHRNYLPVDEYPMSELPPFAIGPHYLLSQDCVTFIARNAEILDGIGSLEDVSVAFWLMAIGVRPQHTEQFINARLFGCLSAVSIADLTPLGILSLHDNRIHNRPPCDNFDELGWVKTPRYKISSTPPPPIPPPQKEEPPLITKTTIISEEEIVQRTTWVTSS